MTLVLKTIILFILTAVAEIAGCYLPLLRAGRAYAAYGGVYVAI